MTELYNLTSLKASSSVIDLILVANEATDELLIGLFMIAITLVILLVYRRYNFLHSLAATSLIMLVLSIFLYGAELITLAFPITYLVLCAGSITMIQIGKRAS